MRTTLDIDEDVLLAAKEIAGARKQSLGKVFSEIFRHSIRNHVEEEIVNGVSVIRRRSGAKLVTMEHVNKLRDELP